MQHINLTPHAVVLNNGRIFPPSGAVARVTANYTSFDANGIAEVKFGEVTGLPAPVTGTLYIVSGLVAQAAGRSDVVSPATGHPACVRKDGQVVSVPGFIRA